MNFTEIVFRLVSMEGDLTEISDTARIFGRPGASCTGAYRRNDDIP